MMKKFWLIFFISFSLFSCKEDSSDKETVDFGYDYFPIGLGQTSIYQIDSILYDDFANTIDTFSIQRKEQVVNSFLDDSGRESYRIEISTKRDDTSNWLVQKVFSYTLTSSRLERKEDNSTSVNLVFPISVNKKWDGNAFNINEELEFTYTSINVPFVLNGLSYTSTLSVLQEDEFNRIQQFYTEEKYARNVGLIYREDNRLNTELNGDIRNGFKSKMTLLEFIP